METVKMRRELVETNVHPEEAILLVYADFEGGGPSYEAISHWFL